MGLDQYARVPVQPLSCSNSSFSLNTSSKRKRVNSVRQVHSLALRAGMKADVEPHWN